MSLPAEIYCQIFLMLRPSKRIRLRLICKAWRELIDTKFMWRDLCSYIISCKWIYDDCHRNDAALKWFIEVPKIFTFISLDDRLNIIYNVLEFADLDLIKYVMFKSGISIDQFCSIRNCKYEVISRVCKNENIDVFKKFIIEMDAFDGIFSNFYEIGYNKNGSELMKWINRIWGRPWNLRSCSISLGDCLEGAFARGNISLAKSLLSDMFIFYRDHYLYVTCKHGNIKMLEWFVEKSKIYSPALSVGFYRCEELCHVLDNHHSDMIKLIIDKYPMLIVNNGCERRDMLHLLCHASSYDIELAKWLCHRFLITSEDMDHYHKDFLIIRAIENPDLNLILDWIMDKFNITIDEIQKTIVDRFKELCEKIADDQLVYIDSRFNIIRNASERRKYKCLHILCQYGKYEFIKKTINVVDNVIDHQQLHQILTTICLNGNYIRQSKILRLIIGKFGIDYTQTKYFDDINFDYSRQIIKWILSYIKGANYRFRSRDLRYYLKHVEDYRVDWHHFILREISLRSKQLP